MDEESNAKLERKVVCSNIELRQVLPPDSFPNGTVTLILSNNKIEELKNGSFIGLTALERLDIRNNAISHIEPGAFLGLPALKRLDLSKNKIGCLNMDIFKGLVSLVKLNLSGNLFSSLSPGTFDSLVSLKMLEFHTQFLLCDCNLLWLVLWIKERGVTVKDTRCSYPRSLQGQLVTSLKPQLLTCDAPLELPSFQLTPSQRQVVFRGDSLPFQCLASYVDEDMQVLWYQDGRMVEHNATLGFFIEESMVQNCSLISSALTIANIQPSSSGNWECRVRTSRGNNTRAVHIVVLESSAKYCPADRVSNNKGDFRWPRTMAGITAYLPCHRLASGAALYSGSPVEERRAWRKCDRAGLWAEDDYSRCQYQKDVTRVLHIINQMPLNLTNAVTTARQLLVYTEEAANFSDKMDVIFVAQMIEKFGKFAEKYKELGDVMVDISSNLMLADDRVLWMAQREARACSRIVECLQRMASQRLASGAQGYSTNSHSIALEAHAIKASSFNGMTCTLFQKVLPERRGPRELSARDRDPDASRDRQLSFKCNVTSTPSALPLKNTVVEATVQLPPSLLTRLSAPGQSEEPVHRLQLLAFRNGRLFPTTGNSSLLADQGKRRSVVTPVILVTVDGQPLQALRSPVNVTLRRFARGGDVVAATWDFALLGGQGGWETGDCHIVSSDDNFTSISCDSLGNYALLMDLSEIEPYSPSTDLLHPVVYASATILLLCLLSVIISYIYHHKSILISRKCWHMLVNLCLHIFLTCLAFVGGVTQTRHASVCQAVGIVLHYSSMATVLWVGVTARNIYKQVTRKAKRFEDLDEPPPPPRPMLRFYLIGGGIPIIVCGITAAANIKNYGSQINAPYCWMAWEPSLGAFYGPVGFIIFVDCMYFLCILLQLSRHPERRHELKEPTEEQLHLAGGAGAHDPFSQGDAPPSELENEHTFPAQLLGVALALLLSAGLWVCGALAVSRGPLLGLLFSCLFGALALGLGAFLIAHHCANREDVRRLWASACCRRGRDYSQQVNAPPAPPVFAAGNGEGPKHPGSSAESSCTNRSTSSSLRGPAQGSKLTNLQAEAAQREPRPAPGDGAAPGPAPAPFAPDGSVTEQSPDSEAQMHVAPVEAQARPNGNAAGRPQKSRARAHRASRLAVLREYAYDASTSVEGSEQNCPVRGRHDGHPRGRRAAHLAHRGRQRSQNQLEASSDVSTAQSQPSLNADEGRESGGGSNSSRSEGGLEADEEGVSSTSKGSSKEPANAELEGQPKSYGLNLANQNGLLKDSVQNAALLINPDRNGNIKTGLWKHETTV
ncbi:hypothetical protein MATL_G00225430 [Megalops atlanticus]|uniref:Adhesion G protein-coupled receptor A3 n=1 Tax=Megalops atlanticus TaxID=7932 RepID=A0A9D3PIS6_MEGAT|nr:hypothetical protein MATL_G00225430 [Megalops atlanticus]